MHFAVVKLTFSAPEKESAAADRKDLTALVDKLRARFRITAMVCSVHAENGETSIVYASLAQSEESLTRQLDGVTSFCEEAGVGRIADETVLMDHIEAIGEANEDE